MKKLCVIIILLIATCLKANNAIPVCLPKEELCPEETQYDVDFLSYSLGYKESSNNYKAFNKDTYCMGKYQFKPSTLKMLKIHVTKGRFLLDSCLQEEAFLLLLEYNYQFLLRNGVIAHVGKKSIDGIPITTEGLIAASHLCGPLSVYDYVVNRNRHTRMIKYGNILVKVYKEDFNGTKIQTYLNIKKPKVDSTMVII